jgi:hypothetical protein
VEIVIAGHKVNRDSQGAGHLIQVPRNGIGLADIAAGQDGINVFGPQPGI